MAFMNNTIDSQQKSVEADTEATKSTKTESAGVNGLNAASIRSKQEPIQPVVVEGSTGKVKHAMPPHQPLDSTAPTTSSSPVQLPSIWSSKEPGSRMTSLNAKGDAPLKLHVLDAADTAQKVQGAAAVTNGNLPPSTDVASTVPDQQQTEAQPLPSANGGGESAVPKESAVAVPIGETAPDGPRSSEVAAEQEPALTPEEQTAITNLEKMLDRISQLDADGWFQHPVSEVDAPNYYKIIKQPMCFQVMRTKVKNKQYVSWTELVRDFDLICSNAIKYNAKRSRVHKIAITMLRAGKKLLAEIELDGRRAISVLHPSTATNGLMNQDSLQGVPSSLLRAGTFGTTTLGATPQSGGTGTATQPLELSEIDDGEQGEANSMACDVDDEPGYSSYGDTDVDENGTQDKSLLAAKRQRSLSSLPLSASGSFQRGQGTSAVYRGIEGEAVLRVPWNGDYLSHNGDHLPSTPAAVLAVPVTPAVAPETEEKEATAAAAVTPIAKDGADEVMLEATPEAAAAVTGTGTSTDTVKEYSTLQQQHGCIASAEWKDARRDIQWRMRWLQSRLQELQYQRDRYQTALDHQQQQQQQEVQPKEQSKDVQPMEVDTAPPSRVETNRNPQPAAAGTTPTTTPLPVGPPSEERPDRQHRERKTDPNLQLPGILEHPFFGDHSVIASKRSARTPSSTTKSQSTVVAAIDAPDFPAKAHAALVLLGSQLSGLRQQLIAIQQPAAGGLHQLTNRMGSVRGTRGRSRGRGRGRGSGSLSRQLSLFAREDSQDPNLALRTLKRRRTQDSDINDFISPGMAGTPKYVERIQVKNIETPRVRVLSATEQKSRSAAINALGASLKDGKPAEKKAALAAIDALCPDESSDEEDISDEAYAKRHLVREKEEKLKYEVALAANKARVGRKDSGGGGKPSAGKGGKGNAKAGSRSKPRKNNSIAAGGTKPQNAKNASSSTKLAGGGLTAVGTTKQQQQKSLQGGNGKTPTTGAPPMMMALNPSAVNAVMAAHMSAAAAAAAAAGLSNGNGAGLIGSPVSPSATKVNNTANPNSLVLNNNGQMVGMVPSPFGGAMSPKALAAFCTSPTQVRDLMQAMQQQQGSNSLEHASLPPALQAIIPNKTTPAAANISNNNTAAGGTAVVAAKPRGRGRPPKNPKP